MELYIAGINHFDPLCRLRLIEWLNKLSSQNTSAPAFVAVEADEQVYQRLLHQRELFRQMLEKDFPKLHPDEIKILVLSIYYEADTHPAVFPETKVVWLDAKRVVAADTWNNYAKDRLNIYKRLLDQENPLNKISEQKWNFDWNEPPTTPLGDPDYARDRIFHNEILNMSKTSYDSWAIAIVGASHAASRDNSMRRLLEASGLSCHVDILNGNRR